jgi:hypothetical protein
VYSLLYLSFPFIGDLGILKKLTQIVGDFIGDLGTFNDVLGRFQGFFGADFGDIQGIYLQS